MLSLPLCQQIVTHCIQIEPGLAAVVTIPVDQIDWRHVGDPIIEDAETPRVVLDQAQTGSWLVLLVCESLLSSPSVAERAIRRYLLTEQRLAAVIALPASVTNQGNAAMLLLHKPADAHTAREFQTERVYFFAVTDAATVIYDLYAAYVRAGVDGAAQAYTVGKTDSSRYTAARRLLGNRLSAAHLRFQAVADTHFAHDVAARQALRPILQKVRTQGDLQIDDIVAKIERSHLKKRRALPATETVDIDVAAWDRQVQAAVGMFASVANRNASRLIIQHKEEILRLELRGNLDAAAVKANNFNLSVEQQDLLA